MHNYFMSVQFKAMFLMLLLFVPSAWCQGTGNKAIFVPLFSSDVKVVLKPVHDGSFGCHSNLLKL